MWIVEYQTDIELSNCGIPVQCTKNADGSTLTCILWNLGEYIVYGTRSSHHNLTALHWLASGQAIYAPSPLAFCVVYCMAELEVHMSSISYNLS